MWILLNARADRWRHNDTRAAMNRLYANFAVLRRGSRSNNQAAIATFNPSAPIPTAARSTGEPVGERSAGPHRRPEKPRPPTGAPGEGDGERIYEPSTGTR